MPAYPQKILIFQWTGNVGDMVCITPMFRAIKSQYPQSRLIVIGKEKAGEMVRGNPLVDEYLTYRNDPTALIKKIKSQKIDFACLTNPGLLGLAMLYLAGIKAISVFSIVNFPKATSRLYHLLTNLVIRVPFWVKQGRYMPQEYLRLLVPFGINNDDTHFQLFYSPTATQTRDRFFKDQGIESSDFIVAFAPGGGERTRWWPAECFAKLADYFYKKYQAKIWLIGAGEDQEPIETMLQHLGSAVSVFNLYGQSLDELKAFLAKASLVVANDSGPVVIAEAFDVPTMVLIGPTDERDHHREQPFNRIIKSPQRGDPETYSMHWTGFNEARAVKQIEAVTLEMAVKTADELVTKILSR